MVNYERIKKLELVFGWLVTATFLLVLGLTYLMRNGIVGNEPQLQDDDVFVPIGILMILVPPVSMTVGCLIHTVLRSVAGLVLILLMGVPIFLTVCYLLFFALLVLPHPREPLGFLVLLLWVMLAGCTFVTIVLAGIFGNPDRHMR